jgi:hypothetical protein
MYKLYVDMVDMVEGSLLVAKNAVSSKLNNEHNGHLSKDEHSKPNEVVANASPFKVSNKHHRLSNVVANLRPLKTHRLIMLELEVLVHVSS